MEKIIGIIVTYKVGITSSTWYWLYYVNFIHWRYSGKCVLTSSSRNYNNLFIYKSDFITLSSSLPIRPILTLKSGLSVTGSGTSSDPFVLS